MIDANNKCHLLEINYTPSFTTDTPLDELVKSNLIKDTLTLMNINPKTRDKILSELKSEN
jgi:tubulin polyglutamylase TTLL6/13